MSETPYVPGGPIREVPIESTPFARGQGPIVIAPPATELTTIGGPSRAWRIVRMALGVLGIIALIEAVIVMTMLFALAGAVTSRIGDIEPTPDVGLTGCPFVDPADCGD
jgi:hypothetical protein